jgi:hypothetical protein
LAHGTPHMEGPSRGRRHKVERVLTLRRRHVRTPPRCGERRHLQAEGGTCYSFADRPTTAAWPHTRHTG